MKDIFTDLYNKVLGFFRQAEKKEEESAKDVACNRLKFVIMQDRTNLTPELMDRMRNELIELLSKYVEMDKDALELGFEQEGTQMALMLSIPVVRAKDEAEIEAILAKEDEEKAKLEAEAISSDEISGESSQDADAEDNVETPEAEDEAEVISESDVKETAEEENSSVDEVEQEVVASAVKDENNTKTSVATATVGTKTATATVERKTVKASVK